MWLIFTASCLLFQKLANFCFSLLNVHFTLLGEMVYPYSIATHQNCINYKISILSFSVRKSKWSLRFLGRGGSRIISWSLFQRERTKSRDSKICRAWLCSNSSTGRGWTCAISSTQSSRISIPYQPLYATTRRQFWSHPQTR